ncbi:putative aldo/keto reductase-like oxidoreductase [Methanococcus voltae PS]|uniref:Aldo/keto reductase-like oxidoreductase n=1 Tax=Methanococcus voltae PS TaxID=523842 RepID=A0ABT2EYL6_METVO|nr:aldo/keto reductase [Methanococcus voltae]MCS3922078.1 putative aldo/keto reductase-like oxidoreductase [Methanococcus voltae PS]
MNFRTLNKTGEELSILGFGAMRFPLKNGRIDKAKSEEMLTYAIDNGVNFIDTAFPYHFGESEIFLGNFLSKNPEYRDKVSISTKLPPWDVKKSEDMYKILNTQLNKLQTDCIDYYFIHSLTKDVWDKLLDLGILKFLDDIKKSKKVKYVGFSFHDNLNEFKRIVDYYDWDMCMVQYNYLDDELQAGEEGILYAARKGMGIFIMEPLRGGNLANNVPKEITEIFEEYTKKHKYFQKPSDWAFKWVWNNPNVTCVLSGMGSLEQLKENIRLANSISNPNFLNIDELEIISKAKEIFNKRMKIKCTSCNYCMPCPVGVDIPRCFELYNSKYLFDSKSAKMEADFKYTAQLGGVLSEPKVASKCIHCGKCLKECPQSLPIPDLLDEVSKEFEKTGFKYKVKLFKTVAGLQKFVEKLFR